MTRKLWFVLGLTVTLGLGCEAANAPGAPDGTGGHADGDMGGAGGEAGAGGQGGAEVPVNRLGRPRCRPPQGMNGTPSTVEEAVALLNELPKPTSVACFVESLDRPLVANATNSVFSAQPATSYQSPRVFLKVGRTWISVVVDGAATNLVEFGYLLDDGLHSLKGELKLPSTEALPLTAPFKRVRYNEESTLCGACHREETLERVDGDTSIYSSFAYRPRPETRVPIDFLRTESQTCDWDLQPHRCEMLSALFDGGSVDEGEFPAEMETFY
jgi:hypothetical protein